MSGLRTKHFPANISLHIERLVLDGGAYTGAQLGHLQASLERELTTLLRTGGLPIQSRSEMATHGQLPTQRPSQTPDQLGRAMAHGIYTCLLATDKPTEDARP